MNRATPEQHRRSAEAAWGLTTPGHPAGMASSGRAKILRVVPFRNPVGTMLARFSVETPSGVIYNRLRLMIGPRGKRWLGLPDEKRRGQDDQVVLNEVGKAIYNRIIEFRDRATRDRFQAMFLEALRETNPELFAGELAHEGTENSGETVASVKPKGRPRHRSRQSFPLGPSDQPLPADDVHDLWQEPVP
jgi:hypothetical protein